MIAGGWVAALLLSCAAPATQEVPLFDGISLEGWEGDTEKTWRVKDGAIVGGSKQGNPRNEFLTTKKKFTDFILRLEYKLDGTERPSWGGVLLRAHPYRYTPGEVWGYRADIGMGYSGNLHDVARTKRQLSRADLELIKKADKAGEWNRYEIRCEGPRVRIILNGVQTVDFTETREDVERDGRIGLHVQGDCKAEISFRTIIIREIPRGQGYSPEAVPRQEPAPLGAGPEATITIPATKVQFTLKRIADGNWIGVDPVKWREFDVWCMNFDGRPLDGVTRPSASRLELGPWDETDVRMKPDHPALGLRWHSAVAYADWLSKLTGRRFRLPTEAEWAKADLPRGKVMEYCLEPDRPGEYAPILRGGAGEGRATVSPKWYEMDPCRPRSTWWFGEPSHQGMRLVCVEDREDAKVRDACIGKIDVSITGADDLGWKSQPALGGALVRVRGEVVNRGDRAVEELDLSVYYLDAGGWPRFVEHHEGLARATFGRSSPVMTALGKGAESLPLKPGEKRKWQVEFPRALGVDGDVDRKSFGARVEALILERK